MDEVAAQVLRENASSGPHPHKRTTFAPFRRKTTVLRPKVPRNPHDAHRPLRLEEDLDLIFARWERRKVSQNRRGTVREICRDDFLSTSPVRVDPPDVEVSVALLC